MRPSVALDMFVGSDLRRRRHGDRMGLRVFQKRLPSERAPLVEPGLWAAGR